MAKKKQKASKMWTLERKGQPGPKRSDLRNAIESLEEDEGFVIPLRGKPRAHIATHVTNVSSLSDKVIVMRSLADDHVAVFRLPAELPILDLFAE